MVKRILFWTGLGVLSLVLGAGTAWWRIGQWETGTSSALRIGPWQTIRTDELRNDPFTIAQVAVFATFPLPQSEVIYFKTYTDSEGRRLSSAYDYLITGTGFDARYWSLTAYGEGGFLINNPVNRFNYNFQTVRYDADNRYRIHLSSTEKTGNWLPSGHNPTELSLSIRLYHPSEALRRSLHQLALPTIQRIQKSETTP